MNLTYVEYATGYDLGPGIFKDAVIEQELCQVVATSRPAATVGDLANEFHVRWHYQHGDVSSLVLAFEDGIALVRLEDGQAFVCAAAWTTERAESLVKGICGILPVEEQGAQVPLWLWTHTEHGPRKVRRVIDVPAWEDIAGNYPADVQSSLSSLMEIRPEGGRIILWTGVPGTGKTYALRALAREWQSWCSFHYVVDPEVLFSGPASYLIDLLLDEEEGKLYAPGQGARRRTEERWRVLVLEDAGELLALDAREQIGQGLSRLLNVTDGLIGQGLRFFVLITTNEEMGRLHPAVSRSGRCAAALRFLPFHADEGSAWLSRHGVDGGTTKTTTLADLYASLSDGPIRTTESRVGFRMETMVGV